MRAVNDIYDKVDFDGIKLINFKVKTLQVRSFCTQTTRLPHILRVTQVSDDHIQPVILAFAHWSHITQTRDDLLLFEITGLMHQSQVAILCLLLLVKIKLRHTISPNDWNTKPAFLVCNCLCPCMSSEHLYRYLIQQCVCLSLSRWWQRRINMILCILCTSGLRNCWVCTPRTTGATSVCPICSLTETTAESWGSPGRARLVSRIYCDTCTSKTHKHLFWLQMLRFIFTQDYSIKQQVD